VTVRHTLVGRMAAVQMLTMALSLIGVLAVSFAVVASLVNRVRDRGLMNVATGTVSGLSDLPEDAGVKRIARELDQHRPAGVRVEAIGEHDEPVAAAGEGPRLRSAGDDACADQEGWRVCERSVGGLRVLVGRSRRDEDMIRNRFFSVLAGVSAIVLGLGGLASRTLAARGLRPVAEMSRRLAKLRPGTGERLGTRTGVEEVGDLAARFDELLARVDEAFARERRFAAQASHELRTPLTVLRGELEVLAHDATPGREGVQRALASAENLVRLVESLLLFGRADARFDPKDLEVVNLADVVRHEAAQAATRPVSIEVPDEIMVLGDERLLGRAVSNLIDNALKYSTASSQIGLRLGRQDGEAVFRVTNQGPRIPDELQERIFEPFFRDPRARAGQPGHGLGLPLARAVARAHGGEVALARNDGTTAFELRLAVVT
jgi:signal transduction histidine kinase